MQTLDWYTWIILPLIVFLARVIDVGLGTMRSSARREMFFLRKSK
jgi:hypothetical protein